MPSTARSPSSGGSLTSLDPSPPPSTGPSPKITESSKAKARTGASDASSDLSELSSDGEKEGETGEQEEQESVEDVLTSEEDEDDEDDDGSSTDRPFVSPSSRRKPSKGKRKSKAKPVAAIRRPKTSRSKSQSPSKSSSRTKPASSKASAGQPHTSRHTRRESDSFSSASHSGVVAAPMSATSSYGVTNSVGDSDEEDTGRRSSRSRKRTSIVPGQMWEWALPKAPKTRKGKSQANAGSESNHGSPVREPSSPSREPEGASTALVSVDQDEKSGVSAASFEGSVHADEEEDVKPDITTLQSNPPIATKAPDVAVQPSAVPDSNRTSPGLPLADFTKGSRRSFSASSVKKGANPVGEEAPASAEAMDVDPPVAQSVGPRRRTQGPSASPVAAAPSLDLLAQLASTAVKRDPSASTEPEDTAPVEGDAASSAAGDEPGDDAGRAPED
ncbi:hypothetical protein FS837_005102, partial [Tulasnella sp. UAMH 9824]